jgi:phage repressor protein C with HTH and peptisase S24 domain
LGRAGAKLIETIGNIFSPNKSKTQRIEVGEKAMSGAADVVGKLAKAYKMQGIPEDEKRVKIKQAPKSKYKWGSEMSGPELAYMENLKRIKQDVKQGKKFVERMSRIDEPEKLEPTKPRKVRKKPRK